MLNFRLFVGLGNPTGQYEKTRHNAGFWFVDRVVRQWNGSFLRDARSGGMLFSAEFNGEALRLLKPMDYMNLSGDAVTKIARFLKIPANQILVAHDELDFDPGIVRLKMGGGHGGHNGLRDIANKLGSDDFARLRIGIGHPGMRSAVANYVLGTPSKEDETKIAEAIERGLVILPEVLTGSLNVSMNFLHA